MADELFNENATENDGNQTVSVIEVQDQLSIDYTQSDDGLYQIMRLRFNDYFNFSIVAAQDKRAGNMGTCQNECKLDPSRDLCCARIEMYNRKGVAEFVTLQCMDINIIDISTGLWIDDFYYEYECKGFQDRRKESTSTGLAITLATGMLAAATHLL